MAIGISDSSHVALRNPVTEEAFGPIFDSEDHAHDFIVWTAGKGYGGRLPELSVCARSVLDELHREWQDARLDEDGFLIETS